LTILSANVVIAASLTAVVMTIQIGAYAARLAGITTKRIAIAISLFSLLVTASRLAALIITPSLGALADHAASTAIDHHQYHVAVATLTNFDEQMRIVVAANTIGVLGGAFLLPLFEAMFIRGISAFQRYRSVPKALARLFSPRVILSLLPEVRFRKFRLSQYPLMKVPLRLLVANTTLYMVYSVGVVAAYYASVLSLEARTTATGLSGLVNGIGTVAFAIFIDPATALIVDETVNDLRPPSDVATMIFWLVMSACLGTMLAQLMLFPAAEYIASVADHFVAVKHN